VITSFLQYLILLPAYVNILNVYAFCNLHDVSWGTKGDNTAAAPLTNTKTVKDKDGAYIEISDSATDNDANKSYEKFVKR
jgi:chitin synthase